MTWLQFVNNLKELSNGCLEYKKYKNPLGYGRLRHNGKMTLAHRLAWEFKFGKIPEGMLICHTCDNPPCCNPEHLFLGTKKDNRDDMVKKGRGKILSGPNHPMYGRRGIKSPIYGIKRSAEFCLAISNRFKGRIVSQETKEKMSANHANVSGDKNPNSKNYRANAMHTGGITK